MGFTFANDGKTNPKNNRAIEGTFTAPEYVKIPNTGISWYMYFEGNTTDITWAHSVQLSNYASSLYLITDLIILRIL